MFTGIVQTVGEVRDIGQSARDNRFVIATDLMRKAVFERGASIACNGVCLTLVERGPDWFAVEVSTETMSKTTLPTWARGTRVNLEPSLKLGDELGGHMVTGHVDGVAEILEIKPDVGSHRIRLSAPESIMPFLAYKGSVALDGISLTVNDVTQTEFNVNIIPYTWDHTNFAALKVGDKMNVETDMLARYVHRIMTFHGVKAA